MNFLRVCIAVLAAAAFEVSAKPVWQDFSISGLHGDHYKVGPEKRDVVTLEYATGLSWGDTFFFIDHSRYSQNDEKDNYFELAPRLSLSYLSGQALTYGMVKDVYLATTWESGDNFDNYLYGLGLGFNLPYFDYANVNFYRAHNEATKDDWMTTITYGAPLKAAGQDFLFDGFIDWSSSASDHAAELNWTSQWKWNAGRLISPDTRLYLGIEYAHWINKFGIKGVDEKNVSALVKYHF
ncbi:outer membrane protein OmpK [Alkanindiges sp. WGS2144]|uniref:outer membrane protein OmpK n=1 Tax=Alkanindiges sp. WGS2144 TaxID=3366808 RepID=UPI00374FFA4B